MFQCKDLFTLSSLAKVKLISGRAGLHKIIRWGYKAESIHLAKWVHGGELLIVSRMVIVEKGFDLYTFLREAIELGISGALLLIGRDYIEKIPQSVIDLSNNKHFPIFAISWDTPLVDILEEMGHAIANSNSRNDKNKDLIFSIIFENNTSKDFLAYRNEEIQFPFIGEIQFFKIYTEPSNKKDTLELTSLNRNNIEYFVKGLFDNNNIPIVVSGYDKNIIGLINVDKVTKQTTNSIFSQIISRMQEDYPNYLVNIGVGNRQKEFMNYKLSYEQAAKCITLLNKQNSRNQVQYYDSLGLYQLFFDIEQRSLLEEFVKRILGGIISYDKKNRTSLLETLTVYLYKNCNLYQTSEQMFTHRNTVKYRLQRIEEITCTNLEDPIVRLNFFNAILMKNFLQ